MPTLTIRNVEPDTHAFYRKQAAHHGCSMEEEIRRLLVENKNQHQVKPADLMRRVNAIFADIGGGNDLAEVIEKSPHSPVPEPTIFDE